MAAQERLLQLKVQVDIYKSSLIEVTPHYFATAFFCFQKNQAIVITTLIPTAIHSPPLKPALDVVRKAPDIAPQSSSTAPRKRRFLSAF